ncbi:MAG: hypothetical protein LBD67_02105 [Candidatus Accumulibacter sp.]|jgi:hypothetical protein|nr:hypothetical protein [Accumulibacter sp.]
MSNALSLLRELKHIHDEMAQRTARSGWQDAGALWETAEARFAALKEIPLAGLSGSERIEARQLIETLLNQQKTLSAQARTWMDQARPLLESFDRHPVSSGPKPAG